jgi:hypothetical protein
MSTNQHKQNRIEYISTSDIGFKDRDICIHVKIHALYNVIHFHEFRIITQNLYSRLVLQSSRNQHLECLPRECPLHQSRSVNNCQLQKTRSAVRHSTELLLQLLWNPACLLCICCVRVCVCVCQCYYSLSPCVGTRARYRFKFVLRVCMTHIVVVPVVKHRFSFVSVYIHFVITHSTRRQTTSKQTDN